MLNDCYRPNTSETTPNIGNLPKDYKHEPRRVNNVELIVTPSLILKKYTMNKENELFYCETLVETSDFISGQVAIGKIKPLSGLGFVILSHGMINVARWDDKCPIVLKNQVYKYEKGHPSFATLQDIREAGSFCVWELGIVNHERKAWKRFLSSQGTNEDKEKYLDDIMHQGVL